MIKRVLLQLFVLFLLAASLEAQEKKEKKSNPSPPNPVDLEISWWKYFSEGEDLPDRIDRMINELKELKASLKNQSQAFESTQVDRLILSLKTLKEEEQKEVEYHPEHPLYLNTYHLTDWLKIARNIRNLERARSHKELEQKQIQSTKDLLRQDLDILQTKYQVLPASTVDKLKVGLTIVNSRVKIELFELKYKRNQKILTHIDQNLKELTKEKQFAEDHLDLTNLQPSELKAKIEESQKIVDQAEEKLLGEEKEQFQNPEEDNSVEILLSKVLLLKAQIQLLFHNVIYAYDDALDHGDSAKPIDDKLSGWRNEINRAQAKIDEWHSITETAAEKINKEYIPKEEAEIKNESQKMILDKYAALQQIQGALNDISSVASDIKIILRKFEQLTLEKSSYFKQVVFGIWQSIKNFFFAISHYFSFTLFRINDYPVTPWVFLRSLIILIVSIFFAKIILRETKRRPGLKKKIGSANLYIIARLVYYLIIIAGVAIAFFSIGFDITNFVIIAGALGVGIGLGLQSLVNNFISGLLILFEKNIRVGDILELENGHKGRVTSISIRSSRIRSFNGLDIIVPNSELISKSVVNWTMKDQYIRIEIPFGVGYGSDKKQVRDIVLEAIKGIPYVMEDGLKCPKPQLWLIEFGESSLNFQLVAWVDLNITQSYSSMNSEFLWQIETALTKNGIEIPFPQRDVHIKN